MDYIGKPATSFMNFICHSIHPRMQVDSMCAQWFNRAIKHCSDVIFAADKPRFSIWRSIASFLYPEQKYELADRLNPIKINPTNLTMDECKNLMMSMMFDYTEHAPNYETNNLLYRKMWHLFFTICLIFSFFPILSYFHRKASEYAERCKEETYMAGVTIAALHSTPNQREQAHLKHCIRVAQTELRRLRISHIVQPQDLFQADGTRTLILRVSRKLSLIDDLIKGNVNTIGTFYKMSNEGAGDTKMIKYPRTHVQHAVDFLGDYSAKLHVIVVFDTDPEYDELAKPVQLKEPKPPRKRRRKTFDASTWGKSIPQMSYEKKKRMLAKYSPRGTVVM